MNTDQHPMLATVVDPNAPAATPIDWTPLISKIAVGLASMYAIRFLSQHIDAFFAKRKKIK